MTSNPYLKRLLGEAGEMPAGAPPGGAQLPPASSQRAEEPEQEPAAQPPELVQLWQSGDHMAVAARLMFTEASYADFVDLVFVIGQSAGRELGHLLDELADTEGMEPPKTPPDYQNMLAHIGNADRDEEVL